MTNRICGDCAALIFACIAGSMLEYTLRLEGASRDEVMFRSLKDRKKSLVAIGVHKACIDALIAVGKKRIKRT